MTKEGNRPLRGHMDKEVATHHGRLRSPFLGHNRTVYGCHVLERTVERGLKDQISLLASPPQK